jgi:hypothetical protein
MADEIPEDIPRDIWRYAESVEKVWRDMPPRKAVEHHARAILAERERCAALADAVADEKDVMALSADESNYAAYRQAERAAKEIATAIRTPSHD